MTAPASTGPVDMALRAKALLQEALSSLCFEHQRTPALFYAAGLATHAAVALALELRALPKGITVTSDDAKPYGG